MNKHNNIGSKNFYTQVNDSDICLVLINREQGNFHILRESEYKTFSLNDYRKTKSCLSYSRTTKEFRKTCLILGKGSI
jgi:hypothetical protein